MLKQWGGFRAGPVVPATQTLRTPTAVPAFEHLPVASIAAGSSHSLALLTWGAVYERHRPSPAHSSAPRPSLAHSSAQPRARLLCTVGRLQLCLGQRGTWPAWCRCTRDPRASNADLNPCRRSLLQALPRLPSHCRLRLPESQHSRLHSSKLQRAHGLRQMHTQACVFAVCLLVVLAADSRSERGADRGRPTALARVGVDWRGTPSPRLLSALCSTAAGMGWAGHWTQYVSIWIECAHEHPGPSV
jgi:hypothetical protein